MKLRHKPYKYFHFFGLENTGIKLAPINLKLINRFLSYISECKGIIVFFFFSMEFLIDISISYTNEVFVNRILLL